MTRASLIRIAVVSASALAISLALSGCSESGVASMDTVPSSRGDSVSNETDRVASVKGARLCVNNNSSMNARVYGLGSKERRPLPPAGQICVSNRTDEVVMWVEYDTTPVTAKTPWIYLEVANGWIGYPQGQAVFVPEKYGYGVCQGFDVNESAFFEDDWVRGELKRVADSADYKEFEFSLSPKQGNYVPHMCDDQDYSDGSVL